MLKQGMAILEITGLGPALVTLDTIEKAAPIEIVQYELNDFYGVCARIAGLPPALETAVSAAHRLIDEHGRHLCQHDHQCTDAPSRRKCCMPERSINRCWSKR